MAALEKAGAESEGLTEAKTKRVPREVPGKFAYTTTPGKFKEALSAIIRAERPPKFSSDFMSTVLGVSGGSAAPIPTILKRTKFLNSDNSPSELYSKFKSDGGRSIAAYEGLRNAFPEIFKHNDYAQKLPENEVKDIIVEITGLNKSDGVVRAIYGTFDAIRSFVDLSKSPQVDRPGVIEENGEEIFSRGESKATAKIGLQYNINIILPNTESPAVFNAIFRSLKENLLS